jgi:hypothetical protein
MKRTNALIRREDRAGLGALGFTADAVGKVRGSPYSRRWAYQ